MKIFRGFLIILYALIAMSLGIVVFLYPFGLITDDIDAFLRIYTLGNQSSIIYIVTGIVLIILSLVVILGGVNSKKKSLFIVMSTELGELKISSETIIGLAKIAIQNNKEVKDFELDIKISKENQIQVEMKAKVNNDSIIPELTLEVQKNIKDTIERCTGVAVESVKMEISSLTGNTNELKMAKKEV